MLWEMEDWVGMIDDTWRDFLALGKKNWILFYFWYFFFWNANPSFILLFLCGGGLSLCLGGGEDNFSFLLCPGVSFLFLVKL